MSNENKKTDKGWYSVHRSLFDHWIFAETEEPICKPMAFIDLIGMAHHRGNPMKKRLPKGLILIHRGQLTASLRFLQRRWKWGSKNKVRRFLDLLRSDGMLDHSMDQGQCIITICNYASYQQTKFYTAQHTERERTSSGPAADQQRTKYNNDNNVNNDNKEYIPDEKIEKMGFLGKFKNIWNTRYPLHVFSDYDNRTINAIISMMRKRLEAVQRVEGNPEPKVGDELMKHALEYLVENLPEYYAQQADLKLIERKFNPVCDEIKRGDEDRKIQRRLQDHYERKNRKPDPKIVSMLQKVVNKNNEAVNE